MNFVSKYVQDYVSMFNEEEGIACDIQELFENIIQGIYYLAKENGEWYERTLALDLQEFDVELTDMTQVLSDMCLSTIHIEGKKDSPVIVHMTYKPDVLYLDINEYYRRVKDCREWFRKECGEIGLQDLNYKVSIDFNLEYDESNFRYWTWAYFGNMYFDSSDNMFKVDKDIDIKMIFSDNYKILADNGFDFNKFKPYILGLYVDSEFSSLFDEIHHIVEYNGPIVIVYPIEAEYASLEGMRNLLSIFFNNLLSKVSFVSKDVLLYIDKMNYTKQIDDKTMEVINGYTEALKEKGIYFINREEL